MKTILMLAVALATFSVGNLALDGGVRSAEAGCKKSVLTKKCVKNPKYGDFDTGDADPETIRVKVCINWFNKLNGVPGQKWWGMRLAKGDWNTGEEYKPVYSACKWQHVVPYSVVFNNPNCFKGWRYETDPMTQAGATYHLKRARRI